MTYREFMSKITQTRAGDFNRFGRVYWPASDRVKGWNNRIRRGAPRRRWQDNCKGQL